MSHILAHDGQYFRVDVAEIATPDDPGKTTYACWCSDPFKELKEAPHQACSRFIEAPPAPTYADACRHAYAWIKAHWTTKKASRGGEIPHFSGVTYTVWLFKGASSWGFEFQEFSDAKTLAKAAEKSVEVAKTAITNNESPQPLTIWEKAQ
jgi:hypothetical protein